MMIFHILASLLADWHKRQSTGPSASSLAHAPVPWRSRQPTGGLASSWHPPPVCGIEIHNCGVVIVTVKRYACNRTTIDRTLRTSSERLYSESEMRLKWR